MPYFKCKTCGRTRAFPAFPPHGSTCTGCFKQNQWLAYDGPISDTILAEEDKQYDILTNEYRKLQQGAQNAKSAYEELEQRYKQKAKLTKPERQQILEQIQLCHDACADMYSQMKPLAAALELLGNREAVKKDAITAKTAASQQQELFVGNRQYVSTFKTGQGAAAKILDVPNWSWGLNCAWVEGGISAKAHFTVKIDSNNAYTQIPQAVQNALNGHPNMSADDFLDLCEQEGKGSLLWYDRDGASRPTWTALEMATLLRAGYTFHFGQVVTLTPPQ